MKHFYLKCGSLLQISKLSQSCEKRIINRETVNVVPRAHVPLGQTRYGETVQSITYLLPLQKMQWSWEFLDGLPVFLQWRRLVFFEEGYSSYTLLLENLVVLTGSEKRYLKMRISTLLRRHYVVRRHEIDKSCTHLGSQTPVRSSSVCDIKLSEVSFANYITKISPVSYMWHSHLWTSDLFIHESRIEEIVIY